MDAGFVLALPWDLELDSVGVLTKIILIEWPWLGAYTRDKNTCAGTLAKNVRGAFTQRGAYMRDTTA